ncbi:FecR domain-containing protein [Massilia sp. METH4]|uniref:FecR family protein n=1 Tax=Massilia sp. METH4 TaxID=3123041 RepID=UPI0030D37A18
MSKDLPMSQAEAEALDWFVRRADGLAGADETRFQQWLAADPGHARAYAQWQQDWQGFGSLPDGAVERLRQGLGRPQPATTPPHRSFSSWLALPRTIAVGAGVALLLACGLAGAMWWQPLSSASHATAQGERLDTMLADQSRLQLAPASRALVHIFRTRREIELPEGQARFEISRDPARPLTVIAGALRITVVGTRFSVHHGAHGGGVRVAVEEGHVRVSPRNWFTSAADTVDLRAGQAIGSDAQGALGPVSAVRAADLAPWHERRTSFENATLGEVLAAFSRHGDTGLTVRDPSVAALRLTGTFDLLRPDTFAQLLPQALPVRLAKDRGITEILAR